MTEVATREAEGAARRGAAHGDPAALSASVQELAVLLRGRSVVALTGAGCSTESGIPDYRGEGTRLRARRPMQYKEFLTEEGRRRYWARSAVGWPRFSSATPNAGHFALARLEARGALVGVITQNVDRLHQRAGSRRVVELHGALADVRCLSCGTISPRDTVQERLLTANPELSDVIVSPAPDGDADLEPRWVEGFRAVDCERCGGALKPNVVYFGERVPKAVTDAALALYAEADALLVVGSSLAVFSGYRFLRQAVADGRPVATICLGPVRGEEHARLLLRAPAGAALTELDRWL